MLSVRKNNFFKCIFNYQAEADYSSRRKRDIHRYPEEFKVFHVFFKKRYKLGPI